MKNDLTTILSYFLEKNNRNVSDGQRNIDRFH